MFGDTAVAVNPEDERYHAVVGKKVILPVVNREIPVIGDPYVDIEFGTGCLKITPAHDFNDFEIGLKHGLEQIKVIDEAGRMNENAGPYQGRDRFECREQMVEDFERDGVLIKVEDYRHVVGHCYRTFLSNGLSRPSLWLKRRSRLFEMAVLESSLRSGRRPISSGWRISGTGASPGRFGGVIVSPPGIVINAERSSCPKRRRPLVQNVVLIA
jgi:valyl-tRNA synthetase